MYLVKWLKNKKTNNTKPDKYRSKWKSHTLLMGIWYNHFGKPSDNIYENWTCELYDQAFPLLGIYLIYGTKRHTDEHLEEPKLETTGRWVDEGNVARWSRGILWGRRKEGSADTHATTWMNPENIALRDARCKRPRYRMLSVRRVQHGQIHRGRN